MNSSFTAWMQVDQSAEFILLNLIWKSQSGSYSLWLAPWVGQDGFTPPLQCELQWNQEYRRTTEATWVDWPAFAVAPFYHGAMSPRRLGAPQLLSASLGGD